MLNLVSISFQWPDSCLETAVCSPRDILLIPIYIIQNLMKNRLFYCTISALLLFSTSCEDLQEIGDIDDVAIEAEYALPLFDTELNIQQLFDESDDSNSFLDIDANGNMTLLFDTEGPSMSFDDVVEFPSAIPFQATEQGFEVSFAGNASFQPEKIRFKEGQIMFEVASGMQSDVDVMLMIPELKTGDDMFTQAISLEYDASQSMMTKTVGPIDISTYDLELSSNQAFTIMYEASDASGDVTLEQAVGAFEYLAYEVLEGTWSNESINMPTETIELGLYNNWESGTLTFADPKVRMDIETNIGFPTTFTFDGLTGTTVSQQSMTMTGSAIGQDHTLDYPSMQEIGANKTTSLYIDNSNSNIADLFTTEMGSIDIDLSAETNPGSSNTAGFITDDAAFSSKIFVELPVYGTASDFSLRDEFETDLSDIENVKEAELTISLENSLPVELDIQVSFINQSGIAFDALFTDNTVLVESAQIDSNGDVTQSSTNTLIIDVDATRAAKIFNDTHRIEVNAVVSTANNGGTPVRINANQGMKIDVSAIVKIVD